MYVSIFVVSVVFFVTLSCVTLAHIFFPKEQTSAAEEGVRGVRAMAPISQVPQVPVITESDHTPVPFSYNVPVDSHMNYKNDVVIVVEHPNEHVTIGMAPR